MNSVTKVDMTSPPMTARPSGASISLPCSSASAIGTMPIVMAQAVIRIGRSRSWAPARAASTATLRSRHSMSMKVTSITEFDTDTPMHMIEPMNDSMLSVVPVASSMITTPQSTPGTLDTDARARSGDSK